jgi:hypothetical protein
MKTKVGFYVYHEGKTYLPEGKMFRAKVREKQAHSFV